MEPVQPDPITPAVLIIQHTPTCPPARVQTWLADAGCRLDLVRGDLGERIPADLTGYAGLVVLGGQMGAYDDADHPWLTETKALLRHAVDTDVPTFAICLGHQLLAVACGGEVETSPIGPQIGLVPVALTVAGREDPLFAGLPEDAWAVHWNNDVVTRVPDDAVVLANSRGGVQALRLGSAWSVQFHPEVDVAVLQAWGDEDVASGVLEEDVLLDRLDDVMAADPVLEATWQGFTQSWAARLSQPGVS